MKSKKKKKKKQSKEKKRKEKYGNFTAYVSGPVGKVGHTQFEYWATVMCY
jgi:hypothetical protein